MCFPYKSHGGNSRCWVLVTLATLQFSLCLPGCPHLTSWLTQREMDEREGDQPHHRNVQVSLVNGSWTRNYLPTPTPAIHLLRDGPQSQAEGKQGQGGNRAAYPVQMSACAKCPFPAHDVALKGSSGPPQGWSGPVSTTLLSGRSKGGSV